MFLCDRRIKEDFLIKQISYKKRLYVLFGL